MTFKNVARLIGELFTRNASYGTDLSSGEKRKARRLIDHPRYKKRPGECWFCDEFEIFDLGLCQNHARMTFNYQR